MKIFASWVFVNILITMGALENCETLLSGLDWCAQCPDFLLICSCVSFLSVLTNESFGLVT